MLPESDSDSEWVVVCLANLCVVAWFYLISVVSPARRDVFVRAEVTDSYTHAGTSTTTNKHTSNNTNTTNNNKNNNSPKPTARWKHVMSVRRIFIRWSDKHFNNLHFMISLETNNQLHVSNTQ